MSTSRYIEINSTYRDRKLWPNASEFVIPISQSGTNNKTTSLDAVSLSQPLFSWTSNDLVLGGGSTVGAPTKIDNSKPIQYTSETATFVISTTLPLQQLRNYYNNLIIIDTAGANNLYRRIATYYYLGSYVDIVTYYRALITVYSQFGDSFAYGDTVVINDPTDFSDPNNPLIFVPNGQIQEDAYTNYVVYNETCNQYRPILHYDNITDIIQLKTTGSAVATNSSGPITVGVGNWQTSDNFSLRKIEPTFPQLAGTNPAITSVPTGNSIVTNFVAGMSTITDDYKNSFIRILPYGSSVGAGDTKYEYEPNPSNNVSYKIISYTPNSPVDATFVVNPSFSISPSVGASVEILPFSYDNFSPFVYSGSMVSQQEMVCYEVRLSSITLPNATLTTGDGGRASFYPFLYIELSNVSSSSSGLKNILYSNNPNSTNVIFRVQVYDIQVPQSTPFVRLSGDALTQTIKFKPNDNLYFKVTLPNGELFKTNLPEYYSPGEPNFLAQITALFSFKRTD